MEPAINFHRKEKVKILSLGAESAGRFAFYNNGNIFISENFGDILDEKNLDGFTESVLNYVKNKKLDLILTDLHPLYNSTVLGEKLSQKLEAPRVKVQHHIAHIFSAVGDCMMNSKFNPQAGGQNSKFGNFFGIAADGTGYGLDENIWGGEIFKIQSANWRTKFKIQNDKPKFKNNLNQNLNIERIGSLEEQIMIGGDLAVREPARTIVAILAKLKTENEKLKTKDKNAKTIKTKGDIYKYVKKFYTRNEFELLYNQLQQNFNCQKTTSAGRMLDAAAVFLGFAGNDRKYKHEAAKLLEVNSAIPYNDIELRIENYESRIILDTTYLFQYLIKNYDKDKKRLAATAQLYIAKGFYEIIKQIQDSRFKIQDSFFAGGMANNKIISSYLESKGAYMSKKISRGDEGIAFGQIVYYLLN